MAASIAQFTGLRSAASFVGAKAEKGLPSVACKATGPKQVRVSAPIPPLHQFRLAGRWAPACPHACPTATEGLRPTATDLWVLGHHCEEADNMWRPAGRGPTIVLSPVSNPSPTATNLTTPRHSPVVL